MFLKENQAIWAVALILFCSMTLLAGKTVDADLIDFEDQSLSSNSYFDGYGSSATSGSWQSGGATFNTNQFGPGWSYSNVDDTTTPRFGNQWAAFTGTGFGGGGNYALANSFLPNGAYVNLPSAALLLDVQMTNTTYAALSMQDGDSFAKKFGGQSGDDPDFFVATITGYSDVEAGGTETGSVEVYLADYRFADNNLDYIIDQWTSVDLTSLGTVRSIAFSFDGSDQGQFGLNTPAYAAIDSLRFTPVPEPGTVSIIFLGGVLILRRRCKLRSNRN